MLIVRSLRQDRVAFCVASFIVSNLGSRFVEPPVLNMKLVSGLVSSLPPPAPPVLPASLCGAPNLCSWAVPAPPTPPRLTWPSHTPCFWQVLEDSTPRTPLVFILSPGVDPSGALLQLAEHMGMAQRFHALSLGQGQAPIAARLLREGVLQGQCPVLLPHPRPWCAPYSPEAPASLTLP